MCIRDRYKVVQFIFHYCNHFIPFHNFIEKIVLFFHLVDILIGNWYNLNMRIHTQNIRIGDSFVKEVEIFTDGACQGNPGPGLSLIHISVRSLMLLTILSVDNKRDANCSFDISNEKNATRFFATTAA